MKNCILLLFLAFATASYAQSGVTQIKALTNRWSEATSNQDLRTLQTLYGDAVKTYGKALSRTDLLKAKLDFYTKHPDYSQIIVSDIKVTRLDANQCVSSFTKQYTMNNNTLEVTAYLYFTSLGGKWKIIQETDDITEKHIDARKVIRK